MAGSLGRLHSIGLLHLVNSSHHPFSHRPSDSRPKMLTKDPVTSQSNRRPAQRVDNTSCSAFTLTSAFFKKNHHRSLISEGNTSQWSAKAAEIFFSKSTHVQSTKYPTIWRGITTRTTTKSTILKAWKSFWRFGSLEKMALSTIAIFAKFPG